jgi:hypothetical protein
MPEPNQPVYDRATNRYSRPETDAGGMLQLRARFTVAQINAGADVVAAVVGRTYRLIAATMIAVGGAASGATAVVLLGTRAAAPVTLMSVVVANLTQSALVESGDATAVVLADGASFTPLDVSTAITINKTGGTLAGATAVDVLMTYATD